MIEVTLSGKAERKVHLNPHLIEYIEEVGPDRSALVLTDGKRLVVDESPETLRRRIIEYRREIGFVAQEE